MKVGIVGAGMLGLTLGYRLAGAGVEVEVFEQQTEPGGLLGTLEVEGARIDKYYHCILNSDRALLSLIDEIGLHDSIRFKETRQGVYHQGKLYRMANAIDFLSFPVLSPWERLRLGLTVLGAARVNDWRRLEEVSVEDWLVGLGGKGTFDKLWKPLLRAKFDGNFGETPATYMWSRLKRTSSTRAQAGQKEMMGHVAGSYRVLTERLVERIRERGSAVRAGTPVRSLIVRDGRVAGVELDHASVALDAVIATCPLPVLDSLLPVAYRELVDVPADSPYLGVVCGLLLMDRPLTPFYTLNIADDTPFTGIIETTNLIDPSLVGGYHLVYLPKYVTPGNPYFELEDDQLGEQYLANLERMFPEFDRAGVKHLLVFRERFVEPLHLINRRRPVMPIRSALPGLYVLNNGQIYPDLTNCEASVRHVWRGLEALREDGCLAEGESTLAGGVAK